MAPATTFNDMAGPELTVVCPWYFNTDIVAYQIRAWTGWPESIKDRVKFILIDDGSPVAMKIPDNNLDLIMARIKQDIPWNQPGARNLGAYLTDTEYILFTDIDHEITIDAIWKAVELKKSQDTVYLFQRYFNGKPHHPHPCSFVISKRAFDRTGGFDEDFSGHRGHDDTMMQLMISRHFKRVLIDAALVLHGEAMTACLDRDHTRNTSLLNIKKQHLKNGVYKNGERLRFDWEIVHQSNRHDLFAVSAG